MYNYKNIICEALRKNNKPFNFIDDPNDEIDKILKNKKLSWYPPYLVEYTDKIFMFLPFCCKDYIDEDEIKEECINAQNLIKYFKKEKKIAKFFFITNANEDVEVLKTQKLSSDFGVLHNEWENPSLDLSILESFKVRCKLLPDVLSYLADCKNLKGDIGTLIRVFSKKYLIEKPGSDIEDKMIKTFIKKLLTCDKRFTLDINPINFMSEIEKIVNSLEIHWIRDHYYHAFNTMMLGFMIIDKIYNKFETIVKKHGDDIVLEFMWVLTSLYHDIGYPILLQKYFLCQIYGVEIEGKHKLFDYQIKQNSQGIWETEEYCFVVRVLNDLFNHINNNKKSKWIFDGFPRRTHSTKFIENMKMLFVDKRSHGSSGTLKLAVLAIKLIEELEENTDREYLYRHIMFTSISILFHDSEVRSCFKKNTIDKIKAESFPFSVLLTYVDILQDDRRDLTFSISRPDILKGIKVINEKHITAILNEKILTDAVRKKLLEELKEALSFFDMNELIFDIPEELLKIEV